MNKDTSAPETTTISIEQYQEKLIEIKTQLLSIHQLLKPVVALQKGQREMTTHSNGEGNINNVLYRDTYKAFSSVYKLSEELNNEVYGDT